MSAAAREMIGLKDAFLGIRRQPNPFNAAAVIRIPIVRVLCKRYSSKTGASLWRYLRLLKEINNRSLSGREKKHGGSAF
ncbi:MAG: hypothetical protein AAFN16_05410 [Pseudomonadota bacterium]